MNRREWLAGAAAGLLIASPICRAQGGPQLQSVVLDTSDGQLKLRLGLSARVEVRSFALQDPVRLVLDLYGVRGALPSLPQMSASGPVVGIRSGAQDFGTRLVLDLRQPLIAQPVWQARGRGAELVLGLARAGAESAAVHAVAMHAVAPRIIAIDPGHGGKDPGAVAADNTYEKHVAMAVADRLHARLASDPRYAPTMIRADDRFVPLHERVVIAHQRKADLFVSIHADAAPNRSARGASVYALSQGGASSAMARWIADSENSADDYGKFASRYLDQRDPQLSKVLLDLSMSGTIASSLDFGKMALSRLGDITRLHQHQVEQAGFAVLKSPDIPSLLVETGFMSNADDCRRLCADGHQDELAQSLHLSIDDYFRAYPGRPSA